MNTKPYIFALLLIAHTAADAADPAAEVNLLTGKGTASAGTDIRPLSKGDSVFSGELISSGPNSYVNLKFTDGGFQLLRPNSRFQIESYAHKAEPAAAAAPSSPTTPAPVTTAPLAIQPAAEDGSSRAFFRLLRGGFRAVSGLVGKVDRTEYRIATPVATIGIRGTDFLAVICDAACAADPVVRADLPEGADAEGGLVAGVYSGAIGVNSGQPCDTGIEADATGACIIGESQFLLVMKNGKQKRLPGMPRFLQIDPIPNPLTCAP